MNDSGIPGSPVHDRRMAELVAAALDLPPDRRARFVAEQSVLDPELPADFGREALSLIDASTDAGDFLSGVTKGALIDRVARDCADARGESPGSALGPYRLIEKIGEGGFGSVFLAEQSRPVRRQVALKIIKLGMDTRQVIARFEQERQALAMMEHPHIARVFDAGASPTGRPYFVMELVRGRPITTFCDDRALSIRDRLHLFILVCDAVQHAHLKGVIHRDLKPRNILVSASENAEPADSGTGGAPTPKIIDFGIAKAVTGKLADETLVTEASQFMGTPEYISPEQVGTWGGGGYQGNTGDGVDTRADIYSLGVVLYELLTGITPLAAAGLRSGSIADMQLFIRTVDAPPPSACIADRRDQLPSLAAARSIHPSRLATRLRHDLDWIALRCLEKDPARRYQTAQALAFDIARHLRAEPVEAAPPSLRYRAARFARRNRVAVLLSAIVALGLIVALAGTSFGLTQARRERRIAELQADRAQKTADFLRTTIEGVGPGVALGRDTELLRGLMESAATRIAAGEMAANPQAEVELLLTIGMTQSELGQHEIATATLTAAWDAAQRLWTGDHPTKAACVNGLGQAKAHLLHSEAAALVAEGLEMRRRLFPGDHPDVASSINNVGWVAASLHRLDDGEAAYRESLEMRRRLAVGRDDPLLALSLHNTGALLGVRGSNSDSEALLRESLDMFRRLHPREHPSVATGMFTLALTLRKLGAIPEAEALLRESLAIRRVLYKGDHTLVELSLYHLAALLLETSGDEATEALAMATEGAAMSLRLKGRFGDRTWKSLLLDRHIRRDEHHLAEPIARALLAETFERDGSKPSATVAKAMATLGAVLVPLGRLEEAETNLAAALQMRRQLYKKEHTDIASTMANLADCLHKRGRRDEALALVRDAAAMASRTAAPTQAARRRVEAILAEIESARPPPSSDPAPHP